MSRERRPMRSKAPSILVLSSVLAVGALGAAAVAAS